MRVSSLYEDYVRFHRIQIANRDVDPVYPVLRGVGDALGWTQEMRVRSVFLHVAYYDLGSALAAVDRQAPFLRAFRDPVPGLACGTERRRHRMGDNLQVHLRNLEVIAGEFDGLWKWVVSACLDDDREGNWRSVSERLMAVTGNGRWAAFKTCEMLAEVCGLPLEAPDMGHANSSGPRKGLELVCPGVEGLAGNRPEVLRKLDIESWLLVTRMKAEGAEASLATAETTLCDFHSLVRGRYYCGLDIDVMLDQLTAAPLSQGMLTTAMEARRAALPHEYLGERTPGGWAGPDRARKQVYRKTGEIITRE